jgi:CBS domain-containing protein
MSTELITLAPELTLREAIELLTSEHVTGAPVVAGGVVAGVISATDLLEFAVSAPEASRDRFDRADWTTDLALEESPKDETESAAFFLEEFPEKIADDGEEAPEETGMDFLDEHVVAEAMSRKVLSLPPETSVARGAQFMRESGIHRVLVMEGDALVGIVTTSDVSEAVAEERSEGRTLPFRASRSLHARNG